jgi:predicted membrane protein
MSDFETDIKTAAEDYRAKYSKNHQRGRIAIGLFILACGAVLLLRQFGVYFPYWLFSWPCFILAVGLLKGFKDGFRPGPWMFIMAVGGIFLADRLAPGLLIRTYAIPILLMTIGVWIIVRPKRYTGRFEHFRRMREERWKQMESYHERPAPNDTEIPDKSDFIDVTSVFGGVKKIILSKNFRGGDIVNFMGGTELNLTQADIVQPIEIDATNIFGGTKLIIPPTWDVQSEVVAIFGGVDDKRQVTGAALQPDKIVRLTGTCLFGGIEIRSF